MDQISCVVPVYNEEKSIEKVLRDLIETFNGLNLRYEIIVVNDGSTDSTARILREANLDIKLIEHPSNLGYGAAIKTGIKGSRYDFVLITDGDGTYPSQAIPDLLKYADSYDMVVGARTGPEAKIPLMRKPAKWILTKLANYLSGVKIPDLNSGLRMMRKKVVMEFIRILPDKFSFTTTITLAMLTNNFAVKFTPIDYHRRIGKSKIRPIQDTLNFLQLIIRTSMYFNPLKVFFPIGLVLFLMSVSVLFYSYYFTPYVMDITIVILFVSGVQVIAIGLIADLVDKRSK